MVGEILIIVFFLCLSFWANKYLDKMEPRHHKFSEKPFRVSLRRDWVVGRSICDPMNSNFFDD